MPGIFISYSRETIAATKALADRIETLGYATWLDKDLHGGKAWWDQILTQIRDCEIFVVALSPESVSSTACTREADYAEDLGKPILPIMVADNVGVLPARLSKIHYVDYRKQDGDAIADLAKALRMTPPAASLPQPLPAPPAIPLSYLENIAEQIDSDAPLAGKDQSDIVSQLRGGLNERATTADAHALLVRLSKRPELLARIGKEIEDLLGDAPAPPEPESIPTVQATSTPVRRPILRPKTSPAVSPPGPNASPALHVRIWLVSGALILLWAIVAPLAIDGILSAPTAIMIIPVATVLLAVIWPIQPVYAALLTLAVHMANLIMSFVTGAMWERDRGDGLVVMFVVVMLNMVFAALVSRQRLRGMPQRR